MSESGSADSVFQTLSTDCLRLVYSPNELIGKTVLQPGRQTKMRNGHQGPTENMFSNSNYSNITIVPLHILQTASHNLNEEAAW